MPLATLRDFIGNTRAPLAPPEAKAHDTSAATGTDTALVARFWRKVNFLSGPVHATLGKCWVWDATSGSHGYGRFYPDPRSHRYIPAHRFAYELDHGPVAAGLDVDHLCRVRICIRPSHCEAVTRLENLLRGEGNKGNHLRSFVTANIPPAAAVDLEAVANETGLTIAALRGNRRIKALRNARHEIARRLRGRGLSYQQIGAALGGRNHVTVLKMPGVVAATPANYNPGHPGVPRARRLEIQAVSL